MKIQRILKSALIAAIAATATLCSTILPAHADLTGPKPPKVSPEGLVVAIALPRVAPIR